MTGWPILNSLELAEFCRLAQPLLRGRRIDKVFIPRRNTQVNGYLKDEWALLAGSQGGAVTLIFCLRPQRPYLTLKSGNPLKAAGADATWSQFGTVLAKYMEGAQIDRIETVPGERVLLLYFHTEGSASFCLALTLIPARPEARLLQGRDGAWHTLTSSRVADASQHVEAWSLPPSRSVPPEFKVRPEYLHDLATLDHVIESRLAQEGFSLRQARLQAKWTGALKLARKVEKQNRETLAHAEGEPDWQKFGDLFKTAMHALPPPEKSRDGKFVRRLLDYTVEPAAEAQVPCDPQLAPKAQLEKYYALAKRKTKRLEESRVRLEDARADAARAQAKLETIASANDMATLDAIEGHLGTSTGRGAIPGRSVAAKWKGKQFVSEDGWAILAGRNLKENQELTFKIARGNDWWLHVRGKPGAHVVVPGEAGKSVPLSTLLDAAEVAIHYSGGKDWGKTEVDYVLRKHVKRIKNSSEVSYRGEKTLLISPDPLRRQRLLGGE
ncbi:MAG: NFACT RNA binding domain-containing protein [Bacteriovoracia bacterium]